MRLITRHLYTKEGIKVTSIPHEGHRITPREEDILMRKARGEKLLRYKQKREPVRAPHGRTSITEHLYLKERPPIKATTLLRRKLKRKRKYKPKGRVITKEIEEYIRKRREEKEKKKYKPPEVIKPPEIVERKRKYKPPIREKRRIRRIVTPDAKVTYIIRPKRAKPGENIQVIAILEPLNEGDFKIEVDIAGKKLERELLGLKKGQRKRIVFKTKAPQETGEKNIKIKVYTRPVPIEIPEEELVEKVRPVKGVVITKKRKTRGRK